MRLDRDRFQLNEDLEIEKVIHMNGRQHQVLHQQLMHYFLLAQEKAEQVIAQVILADVTLHSPLSGLTKIPLIYQLETLDTAAGRIDRRRGRGVDAL